MVVLERAPTENSIGVKSSEMTRKNTPTEFQKLKVYCNFIECDMFNRVNIALAGVGSTKCDFKGQKKDLLDYFLDGENLRAKCQWKGSGGCYVRYLGTY